MPAFHPTSSPLIPNPLPTVPDPLPKTRGPSQKSLGPSRNFPRKFQMKRTSETSRSRPPAPRRAVARASRPKGRPGADADDGKTETTNPRISGEFREMRGEEERLSRCDSGSRICDPESAADDPESGRNQGPAMPRRHLQPRSPSSKWHPTSTILFHCWSSSRRAPTVSERVAILLSDPHRGRPSVKCARPAASPRYRGGAPASGARLSQKCYVLGEKATCEVVAVICRTFVKEFARISPRIPVR
jgi:hypothetical protein